MKGLRFCIVFCVFCFHVCCFTNTTKSESLIDFATKAVDVLASDGAAELAARHLLGCDEWSDIGVISTITSVFTGSNPVTDACKAAGMMMSISAGIGALMGGPLGFIGGNIVGNIAAFAYAWGRSGGAKKKPTSMKYAIKRTDNILYLIQTNR